MHTQEKPVSVISRHILPTASNLLAICFVILSFIKVNKLGDGTYLDELLSAPILFFYLASICSYMSLRPGHERKMEKWADKCFMLGLFVMTLISFTFLLKILV